MKKLTLFAMLLLSGSLLAQFPYFQQDHGSATAGVDHVYPADIHSDGGTTVYSYHLASTGGNIIVKYNAGTGAITNIVYLFKNGQPFSPVRVRTQGNYYYGLFNINVGGLNRYCLIKLDLANTVIFLRQALNGTNTFDVVASDFIVDGTGTYAYVLGNAYDPVIGQNDLYVAKIDVSTAAPTVVWSNIYQNTAREEAASNIILHNNELFASFNSVDMASFLDRGPGLLKLDLAGNYLLSKIYKYSQACQPCRAAGTWVMTNGNQLTLSSISYVGADGNGPLWLANINPANLVFTLQVHHSSGAAYMVPEIQNVSTAAGNRILMSGAASFVNTLTPGYVHYYFNAATLAFTSGAKYPTTTPDAWGGPICDAYISSGTGMNVFSVATNYAVATNSYHLLKTSDLGDNGCDVPVSISPSSCIMDHYNIPMVQLSAPTTLSIIKQVFLSSVLDNYTQSCLVTYCPTCPPIDMPVNGNAMGVRSALDETLQEAYPNPTTGLLTIAAAEIGEVRVYTIAGTLVNVPVRTTGAGAEIDLSAEKEGIYIVEAVISGERRSWRIIKQ